MTEIRKIQYTKSGRNYSITLPPKLIGDLGWSAGDHIVLVVRADTLTLRKVKE